MNRKRYAIFNIFLMLSCCISGCFDNNSYDKYKKIKRVSDLISFFDYLPSAPVLNDLVITATNSSSITLAQPTLKKTGNPQPRVIAYIGEDNKITITDNIVENYIWTNDVSYWGSKFNELKSNTVYRIIVIAYNDAGYSVQQIAQSTAGIAPVLKALDKTSFNVTSITLAQPTFSMAGNPLPQVHAYIGLDENISVSGSTVSHYLSDPIDVSAGGYTFSGLSENNFYRIIVIAQNNIGYSVQQITQLTYNATATRVYGQGGSFTSDNYNNGGLSADSLFNPHGVAVDSTGVYVADSWNSRVLYYPGTSTTATRVYGTCGSFTSFNCSGESADSLSEPHGVTADSTGVYIADTYNNRVLWYSGTSTTASRVYGQGGSFSTTNINNGGISANSLFYPDAVAVDSTGVYIADSWNNRVLYYPGTSTTATRVYGQGGSFTTNSCNNGNTSPNANSLCEPKGVGVDSTGVYIVDSCNNRVLYYPGTSTTPTRVYGQIGNFTTNYWSVIGFGASPDNLSGPTSVAVNSTGVYIVDYYDYRVLYYPGISTTATQVYGQGGSFSKVDLGVSADGLYFPWGIAVDSTGKIYISDSQNHRVLYY